MIPKLSSLDITGHHVRENSEYRIKQEVSHSHPQILRSALGLPPGIMTPVLATKTKRIAFYDTGFPTEAIRVNFATDF